MSKLSFLDDDMRDWIDWRWGWLDGRLGPARLRAAEVPLDPREFLGATPPRSEEDVQAITLRIAASMGLDDRPIRVVLLHADQVEAYNAAYDEAWAGGQSVFVGLGADYLEAPHRMAIALMPALARAYLHRAEPFDPEPPDLALLSELAAIYLGGGVILGNNEVLTEQTSAGGMFYSGSVRMASLWTQEIGYATARFSYERQVVQPAWERHLRADPMGFYKKTLAAFRAQPPANLPTAPQWYIDLEQAPEPEPDDWTDEETLLANVEDYDEREIVLYCLACANKLTHHAPGHCPACDAAYDPEDLKTVSTEKPLVLSEANLRRIALLRRCIKWGIPLGIALLILIGVVVDLLSKRAP
ncbi:hypothetical protein OT109_08780 [Phycisphaeraceae bacterium D3-23]